MEPRFRRMPDGTLDLRDTPAAYAVLGVINKQKSHQILSPEKEKNNAKHVVRRMGGDVDNAVHVLGQHRIPFGKYRGQPLKWLVENVLGYVAYLLCAVDEELKMDKHTPNDLMFIYKMALKKYMNFFPEGKEAISLKTGKTRPPVTRPTTTATSTRTRLVVPPVVHGPPLPTTPPVTTSQPTLPVRLASPSGPTVPPTPPLTTSQPTLPARLASPSVLMTDDELLAAVTSFEAVAIGK